MSFLKKMVKAVTGKAAQVYVEAIDPAKGSPFLVKVKAMAKDEDLDIKRAYVRVRGLETINARGGYKVTPPATTRTYVRAKRRLPRSFRWQARKPSPQTRNTTGKQRAACPPGHLPATTGAMHSTNGQFWPGWT
jgi:hypothetical protein